MQENRSDPTMKIVLFLWKLPWGGKSTLYYRFKISGITQYFEAF